MHTASLVTWFGQIFDADAMLVLATRAGVELTERIACGQPTLEDLFLASVVLGRNLVDLLPGTLHHLNGFGEDLLRRDVECSA